jgi:hypothetical protein
MRDLKTRLTADVKKALVGVIADLPRTAFVDYYGYTRKVADHGKIYDNVSNEENTFSPDGSDTRPGRKGDYRRLLRILRIR